MKLVRLLLYVLFLTAACSPAAFGFDKALRVSDGKIIELKDLVKELKGTDVVFIGEVHDNLEHHRAQLSILKTLHESHIPVAVGLEMFRANSQKALDQWVQGGLSVGEFVAVYNDNWKKIPWPWYMKIFKYAMQFEIPLVGLNLPDEITDKVFKQGFGSLNESELKQLPPHITFEEDEQTIAYMRKIFQAHNQSNESFENFSQAQMVWDKTMAYHILNYLKANPGKTVIVLTGFNHARGRGIPAQIKKQSSYTCKIILPETQGQVERSSTTTEDADYLLIE